MTKIDEKDALKSKFREDKIKCEFLTTEEVCEYLNIPITTMRQWACYKPDYLPFIKMGKRNMYRVSDIVKFLSDLKNQPRPKNYKKRGRKKKETTYDYF